MQNSQVLKNSISRVSLLRSLCKESLYYFLVYFWDVIATNEFVDNWHIKEICDEIQPDVLKALKGEKKTGDIIINICPGTTKSTIISQMLPAWCWAVSPSSVIISSTGTSQLTTKNSMRSRDIIQSDKYQELFPEVVIRKDASAKTFYQNTSNGTRYAFTTKGNPIGNHAHVILTDDPESQKDAKNQTMMEYSEESIKALSTRMIDKESTLRILLMQRLSDIDSTSIALKKFTNPKHICLPAELSELVKPEKFKKKYVDGLLDPVRLSKEILKEERKKLNNEDEGTTELDYDAQFGQNPQNPTGYLYQSLKTFDKETTDLKGAIFFTFTDSANGGTDYLCTFVIALLDSKLYVVDAVYSKESSSTTFLLIEDLLNRYSPTINFFELNSYGSMFAQHFKGKGFPVDGYNQTAFKIDRLIANAFYVEQMYFAKSSSEAYNKAFNDLKKFPKSGKSKNDDSPDCISLASYYFRNKYNYIFNAY